MVCESSLNLFVLTGLRSTDLLSKSTSLISPDAEDISTRTFVPDSSEYGSADDKWLRNAELFLESLLEKGELSFQTSELSNEGIKP